MTRNVLCNVGRLADLLLILTLLIACYGTAYSIKETKSATIKLEKFTSFTLVRWSLHNYCFMRRRSYITTWAVVYVETQEKLKPHCKIFNWTSTFNQANKNCPFSGIWWIETTMDWLSWLCQCPRYFFKSNQINQSSETFSRRGKNSLQIRAIQKWMYVRAR